jgi:hypothetical protein
VIVPFFLKPFGIYLLSMWAAHDRAIGLNRLSVTPPDIDGSRAFVGIGA